MKVEFDQLERNQKDLLKALTVQMKALDSMQTATNTFAGSLGDFLAMEQAMVGKTTGHVAGIPEGMITKRIIQLITLNTDDLEGLKQAYDPGSLERLTGNPIILELKMLTGLRKALAISYSSFEEFQKAKRSYGAAAPEDSNKQKYHESLPQKEIIYFNQRRAMGYELERFNICRTIKFQTFLNHYVRFQLL